MCPKPTMTINRRSVVLALSRETYARREFLVKSVPAKKILAKNGWRGFQEDLCPTYSEKW